MTQGTAIVTGGAGTIGKAVGIALIADGWQVELWDIGAGVQTVADEIGAAARICDILDPDLAPSGPVGALVHCAGTGMIEPFDQLRRARWHSILDLNLTAPLFLTQAALKHMTDGASVTMIASVSGIRAGFGRMAYGTSKAALIHMVRQLALELAPRGITCNAVAPGPVDGPLANTTHPAQQVADYLASIPQGRYAQASEVADAVAFLSGPRARHITGQCLAVDGGYLAAGVGVAQARNHFAETIA
jgi:3-oxoacyl-[acyl-carrier protein] reductase